MASENVSNESYKDLRKFEQYLNEILGAEHGEDLFQAYEQLHTAMMVIKQKMSVKSYYLIMHYMMDQITHDGSPFAEEGNPELPFYGVQPGSDIEEEEANDMETDEQKDTEMAEAGVEEPKKAVEEPKEVDKEIVNLTQEPNTDGVEQHEKKLADAAKKAPGMGRPSAVAAFNAKKARLAAAELAQKNATAAAGSAAVTKALPEPPASKDTPEVQPEKSITPSTPSKPETRSDTAKTKNRRISNDEYKELEDL